MEITIEKDTTNNGNEDLLVRWEFCEKCNEGRVEKYKERTKFINVGTSDTEWVCTSCGVKTAFGKEKLVKDNFGWHFEKI